MVERTTQPLLITHSDLYQWLQPWMRRLPRSGPRIATVARNVRRRHERGAAAVARAHTLAAAIGGEYREQRVGRRDATLDDPLQQVAMP